MKKNLLLLLAFSFLGLSMNAQNNVKLNIRHLLGENDFAFNQGAKNNIGHDFNVTRLQYYISEISIIHDGGMETAIPEFWVLVDASEETKVDLGDHDITEVEAVHFHIGVDPNVNHSDPSLYPAGHPLAPVFPSMHWGWAAGYRFVAMEGFGSSNYNQMYQLHGLGDGNYFKTEVPVLASAENGSVSIFIEGDYARALEDIEVNGGVISHGEFGAAKKALENFRDHVFIAMEGFTSTLDFSEVTHFNVFPNPVSGRTATVNLEATENLTYDVSVTDVLGRTVEYIKGVPSNSSQVVTIEQPGIYLVNLIKEGQVVLTQKLVK